MSNPFHVKTNWVKPAELKDTAIVFEVTKIEGGYNTFEGVTTERWIFHIQSDDLPTFEAVLGLSRNSYRDQVVEQMNAYIAEHGACPPCRLTGKGKSYAFEMLEDDGATPAVGPPTSGRVADKKATVKGKGTVRRQKSEDEIPS